MSKYIVAFSVDILVTNALIGINVDKKLMDIFSTFLTKPNHPQNPIVDKNDLSVDIKFSTLMWFSKFEIYNHSQKLCEH
jgi:hypothetical protein